MKQMIVCALIGFLLMGCNEEIVDRPAGDGEGRLVFSDFHIESVVGDIQTKASLEQGVIPQASDFELTVVDATTSAVVKKLPAGVTDCFLSEGTYKVQAVYGDEAAMSATPYFFGESNVVTITKGAEASVSLTASLACAVLRPVIDPELATQYETYKLTVQEEGKEADPVEVSADKDLFVRGGAEQTYILTLAGTNQLSEAVSHTWKYSNLVVRTRYIINCNPDLPAFTLPAQSEGNVWSKFMYITPMTAENMTAHSDMAEKVIANVVYEASKDNGQTWIASEKLSDGRHVIKGLEPSTTYTVRSRFGAIYSSDVRTITTENAQPLENGDMEKWEEVWVANAYASKSFYNYFLGSQNSTIWQTNNAEGLNGATTHATKDIGTYWRWCAGTRNTSDVSTLNADIKSTNAAEISTLGFYSKKITGWYAGTISSKDIISKWLSDGNRVCLGKLYVDKISLDSRPSSISFDYKYEPVAGDLAPVEMVLFDSDSKVLWKESMSLDTQSAYLTKKVSINHQVLDGRKVAFITLRFQSGTDTNYKLMHVVEGDYNLSPRVTDRVVGSVLKIDNVTLNYDYE